MQLRDLFDELPVSDAAVIPLELQQLLRADLNVKEDWQQAEQLLLKARKALPRQTEILIALYKLYAYSNRFAESLQIIQEVLQRCAEAAGFDPDWRVLDADSAKWNPAVGSVRHYLYSLKATGFVSLRSGDVDVAFAVLSKLSELDPQDQVGGSVVLEMAESLRESLFGEEAV